MPNGRQGDHPYTDIVHHNLDVFGAPIDDLVRQIDQAEGFHRYREEVHDLLWENNPNWRDHEPDRAKVAQRLQEIQNELTNS